MIACAPLLALRFTTGVLAPLLTRLRPDDGEALLMLIVAAPVAAGPVPCRSRMFNWNSPAMSSVFVLVKFVNAVALLPTKVSSVDGSLAGTADQLVPADQESVVVLVGVYVNVFPRAAGAHIATPATAAAAATPTTRSPRVRAAASRCR